MNQNPRMREIAVLLISYEATENRSANSPGIAAFPISEKLRPHLATLMGYAGFSALLGRALALAGAKFQALRSLHVNSEGKLERLDNAVVPVDPEGSDDGAIVLIEQLLELLVAFIGKNLTMHLLCEVWPKLSRDELNFGDGVTDEK